MSNDQNNQNNNIDAKDFLIGSLIGGIVGAATALLLAPKSGKELRSNLNDQAIVLKDKGNGFASRAKETSQTFAKSVQEQTTQVAGKVRDISDRFTSDKDAISEDTEEEPLLTQEQADELEDAMGPDFEDQEVKEPQKTQL